MGLENLGLTIFDTLGYLLPGYVVLFSISLAEATFSKTSFFNLKSIGDNFFPFAIFAYFLGLICHILFTLITNWFYKVFRPSLRQNESTSLTEKFKASVYNRFHVKGDKLSDPLYRALKKAIKEAFHLELFEGEKLNTQENYLLADSYILAMGAGEERTSLAVREGFFKTSTIAFVFLTISLLAGLVSGGQKIQVEPGNVQTLGVALSRLSFFVSLLSVLLLRDRYNFYHRMKMNNTHLLFLAYRAKEQEERK